MTTTPTTKHPDLPESQLRRQVTFREFLQAVALILESAQSNDTQVFEILECCSGFCRDIDSPGSAGPTEAERVTESNRLFCSSAIKSLRSVQIRPGNTGDLRGVQGVLRAATEILSAVCNANAKKSRESRKSRSTPKH